MNKLTKLLSVFAIAGAIGCGVAGVAGCNKTPKHEHNYTYEKVDDTNHKGTCQNDGCDKKEVTEGHKWGTDNKCTLCDATKPNGGEENPGGKLTIAADVTGLVVEGYGDKEVTLSASKKSHAIDKSAIKVYFGTGTGTLTKGDAVPADNLDISLRTPASAAATSWEGLTANGDYSLVVRLKNVNYPEGKEALDYTTIIAITVNNPVIAGTLRVKEGATLTQAQSTTDSMTSTWAYQIQRASEDWEDVAADNVTVGNIDHVHVASGDKEDKTVSISTVIGGKTVKGSVAYSITKEEGAVVQSYAVNANKLATASYSEKKVINEAAGISIVGSSGKAVAVEEKAVSGAGKEFTKWIKLGGSAIQKADRGLEVGASVSAGWTDRHIELANLNEAATGATAKTLITVYASPNSAGQTRALTLYKVTTDAEGKKVYTVAGSNNTKQPTTVYMYRYTYEVSEAGNYVLASEDSNIVVSYIQIDKIVKGDTGATEVKLEGQSAPVGIEVDASSAKVTYKKDETLSTAGLIVSLIKSNDATADRTEEIIPTGYEVKTDDVDMSTLGNKDVTVEYTAAGGTKYTAKYSILVESAVKGVWGANITLANTVKTTLASATDKATLKLSDIVATLAGENSKAKITVASAKLEDDTAITAEGIQLGKGEHTVTATVHVVDGETSADFTATVALTIVVEGELTNFNFNATTLLTEAANTDLAGKTYCNEHIVIGTGVQAKDKKTNSGDYTKAVQITGTKTISLTVDGACTVKIYGATSSNGNARNATLTGTAATVTAASTNTASTADKNPTLFQFEVSGADTLIVGSDSGLNVFEIVVEYK